MKKEKSQKKKKNRKKAKKSEKKQRKKRKFSLSSEKCGGSEGACKVKCAGNCGAAPSSTEGPGRMTVEKKFTYLCKL